MRIGEAAAESGCPIETIRYYERVGLLHTPLRTDGNYRVYAASEVERLRFITRGRELGFSLEQIRSLLGLAEDTTLPCAEVDQLAREHLADVKARMRELGQIKRELQRTIDECAQGQRGECRILHSLSRGRRKLRS